MPHPYRYVGCFVDREELFEKIKELKPKPLYRIIERPHITFEYKPLSVDETLFGEKILVRITGYGNNGENEGLKVELFSENPKIQEMVGRIEVPHITLSVSEKGEPVNTRFLSFEPTSPIEIIGVYGGYKKK